MGSELIVPANSTNGILRPSSGTPWRGLYVHIPFCLRKCPYCDFFSVPIDSNDILADYTDALLGEIRQSAHLLPSTQIDTIYIGGGTPSLLTGEQIEKIIQTIYSEFALKDQVEITIEANPKTLHEDKIKEIIATGVNRLSLGVQSFNDHDLKILGRRHNSRDVLTVIEKLHLSGLENLSLDLIYGIPTQDISRWIKTLEKAVECNPQHISTYLLQLDANTPMARDIKRGELNPIDEEAERAMYYHALEHLQGSGFEHYEISNFCLPGRECLHNMIYWQAKEYIGIGPGAVSFLNSCRYVNDRNVGEYLKRMQKGQNCLTEELEMLNTDSDLLIDAIILGLRLCKGIRIEDFKKRFGIDMHSRYYKTIQNYKNMGLLKLENGWLKLTKRGYFLSNQVLCQFID